MILNSAISNIKVTALHRGGGGGGGDVAIVVHGNDGGGGLIEGAAKVERKATPAGIAAAAAGTWAAEAPGSRPLPLPSLPLQSPPPGIIVALATRLPKALAPT